MFSVFNFVLNLLVHLPAVGCFVAILLLFLVCLYRQNVSAKDLGSCAFATRSLPVLLSADTRYKRAPTYGHKADQRQEGQGRRRHVTARLLAKSKWAHLSLWR